MKDNKLVSKHPKIKSIIPGYKNIQRGLSNNRKLKCRQPSRHLRKCGGRLLPSGDKTVGTSVIFNFCSDAMTTISLANSIPDVFNPSFLIDSQLKPRKPQ